MKEAAYGALRLHATQLSRRSFTRLMLVSGVGLMTLSGRALADAKVGGTLKAAFDHDPAGFDPAKATIGMSHAVIEQVFSTLMALDADAKPYPDVAESVDVSTDGLIYTFKLRSGVNFHDGTPLSADDVKFTIERLQIPETGYSYSAQLTPIKSIEGAVGSAARESSVSRLLNRFQEDRRVRP
jgi:peptide/nickel transport system substrate-binding protein